jgi:hypothetical protein
MSIVIAGIDSNFQNPGCSGGGSRLLGKPYILEIRAALRNLDN